MREGGREGGREGRQGRRERGRGRRERGRDRERETGREITTFLFMSSPLATDLQW